jgi:uncharacterized protein YdeI (BOF family)
MKKRIQTLWPLSVLVLCMSMSIALSAQQTPQTQPPDQQAQQPAQTDQEQPSQKPSQTPDQAGQRTPDSQAQASDSAGQSFTGTIVKSGDKYVFQDATTGNTYDIDHQEEVQKFEGKRVKVHGTLDAANHMIHVQ